MPRGPKGEERPADVCSQRLNRPVTMKLRHYRRLNAPNPSPSMPPSRLLPALALAALLAACAGQNELPTETGVQQPVAQAEPVPRGERVIGHQDQPAEILTPEKARAQCWMRYEKDKVAKDLDAKLKLVDKCTAEKLRGQ